MDGECFLAYVEQLLVPSLTPGDVVVRDNLPAHRVNAGKAAIECVGAKLLYLPPYSPDFNPIEKAFAKLKALFRKAAPRTVDNLWVAIAEALKALTTSECENYFVSSGYDPQ